MKFLKKLIFCLTLMAASSVVYAKLDQTVTLTFEINGKTTVFQLMDLQKRLPAYEVTLFSPVYKRTVVYRAFKFAEVAELVKLDITKAKQISFIASDGYHAVLSQAKLAKFPEPWLAFEELNTQNGETFSWVNEGKEKVYPGPFYFLWQQPDSYKVFPWPFAVTDIVVNSKRSPYLEIKPKGKVTAEVERGFDVFKTRCMSCHSINLVGGNIGPELNIPKNITEYRSMTFLKAWIKDPTSFRAKSRMANFGTVTDKQIEDVLAYIQYMKDHKVLESGSHDVE